MHAVAGKHRPTAGLWRVVMVGVVRVLMRRVFGGSSMLVVLMPVVPQFGLVQQEKEHQPHQ